MPTTPDPHAEFESQRVLMVQQQIRDRGVSDRRVLEAMRRVPRHRFVPPGLEARAYEDMPLPIGEGQTISQPYIVAAMTEILETAPTDRVLEIGTGSGYQTAVLAELVAEVFSIEFVESLSARVATVLSDLGYANIHLRQGNGYLGWPEAAPFDKIVVTAAPDSVPSTLLEQLAPGGLMVVPIGRQSDAVQQLTLIRKTPTGITSRALMAVRFVPMVSPPAP